MFKAEQRLTNSCSFDSINQQRIRDEKLQWRNYFSVSLLIDVDRELRDI